MTAREKFKLGDRVFLSEEGRRRGISTKADSGTVVGFGQSPEIVSIARDGLRTAIAFSMDFWEPAIASVSVEPLP